MKIDIITIFPSFFSVLDESLLGKARERGVVSIDVHDLRDVTTDKHRTVDDTPYGGGAGMVMRPDVWGRALDAVGAGDPGTIIAVPTPTGQPLTQRVVEQISQAKRLVFACGRYEGIDSRVAKYYANNVWEFSIGDYVLNGGETATLVLIEAVTRLLDGAVGNPESLQDESHGSDGLLEHDMFTRPQLWRGIAVPDVLVRGDHAKVLRWRRTDALIKTLKRRPDMIAALPHNLLDERDREVLAARGWTICGPVTYKFSSDNADNYAGECSGKYAGKLLVHNHGAVVAELFWNRIDLIGDIDGPAYIVHSPRVNKEFHECGLEGALLELLVSHLSQLQGSNSDTESENNTEYGDRVESGNRLEPESNLESAVGKGLKNISDSSSIPTLFALVPRASDKSLARFYRSHGFVKDPASQPFNDDSLRGVLFKRELHNAKALLGDLSDELTRIM